MVVMKKLIYLLILVIILSGCAARGHRLELIMNPKTPKDYYQRGGYFHDKMEPLQAIPEYTQAIALDHNYTDAYFMRSLCYTFIGNYEGAVTDLTQAIEWRPKRALYYRFRATAYSFLEDVDRAIADYDTAISLRPGDCWPYLNKAALLFQDARFREAIPAYRGFLRKSPKVLNATVFSFITGGLIGVMTDPLGSIRSAKAVVKTKEKVKEMIQLCGEIIRGENLSDTVRAITPGMSKRAVLKIIMATDKMVTENFQHNSADSLLVTVSRTGPIEDRNIRILVFKKDILSLEKRVPLRQVIELPGISKYTDIPMNPAPPRSGVLELIRKTDYLLYEDDRQIVSVTERETQKGKRVRFFNFDKNKLTSRMLGSRRLW